MAKRNDTPVFSQHQKVVAAHDLPGIPAGTPGKILLINGLSWVRYRVLFDGGDKRAIERGMLSAGDLTTPEAWAAAQQQARAEVREAEREAARAAASARGAVASAAPSPVPDSGGSAA
jgi:hypothetical protein